MATNHSGLKTTVNTSAEKFGAAVTIAHLAQFSFEGWSSDALTCYQAADILERDWNFEIEELEMEYLTGVQVSFKDGSRLSVGTWADCCDGSGCKQCGN